MRALIVEDHTGDPARWHFSLDGNQQRINSGCAVCRADPAVAYREQCCRAVAPVATGHCAGPSLFDRQARLRAVERLDCSFVVDREHDDVSGRIDVGARQYRAAGRRIAGRLDAVAGCGAPDAPDRGDADPGASAIIPTVQSATSPGGGLAA